MQWAQNRIIKIPLWNPSDLYKCLKTKVKNQNFRKWFQSFLLYIYNPFKHFPSCSGVKTVSLYAVDANTCGRHKYKKDFCIVCRRTILIISYHQINSLIFQGNQCLCEEWEDSVCHKYRHVGTCTYLRCPGKAGLGYCTWHFTSFQRSPVHWAGLGWTLQSLSIVWSEF